MSDIDPHILKHLSVMQPELYWLDADPLEPEPHPTLIGDVTTELCIVGAGYTGLWTALLAKERNPEREVIIVEQRETGFGASGRNGGFCNSSLTHGFINGYRRFKDDMQDLRKNASALAFWRKVISTHPRVRDLVEHDLNSPAWNGPVLCYRVIG